MTKTVFETAMVSHVWAQREQAHGRTSIPSGNSGGSFAGGNSYEGGPQWFAQLLGEEESNVWSVERDESPMFYARLSAPGYMDATDWSGPYETKGEAESYLAELTADDEPESESGDAL